MDVAVALAMTMAAVAQVFPHATVAMTVAMTDTAMRAMATVAQVAVAQVAAAQAATLTNASVNSVGRKYHGPNLE